MCLLVLFFSSNKCSRSNEITTCLVLDQLVSCIRQNKLVLRCDNKDLSIKIFSLKFSLVNHPWLVKLNNSRTLKYNDKRKIYEVQWINTSSLWKQRYSMFVSNKQVHHAWTLRCKRQESVLWSFMQWDILKNSWECAEVYDIMITFEKNQSDIIT